MTFDAVISNPTAESFIESLIWEDRQAFYNALDVLREDPYPDGRCKILLDFFPYKPGTIAFYYGEFWITYVILNAATIGIASVFWNPDSPRYSGAILEG